MITKQVFDIASGVVQALDNPDLSTYREGPFMDLCRVSGLDSITRTLLDDDGSVDTDMMQLVVANSTSQPLAMSSLSKRLADTTSAQISQLSMDVIPLIKKTIEGCEYYLEEVNAECNTQNTSSWTVVKSEYPYFILDSEFKLDMSRVSNNAVSRPDKSLRLNQLRTPSDLKGLVMTGDADLDSEILETLQVVADYFTGLDANYGSVIWYNFFSVATEPKVSLTPVYMTGINPVIKASIMAIVYLVAKRLSVEIEGSDIVPSEVLATNGLACNRLASWALSETRSGLVIQESLDSRAIVLMSSNLSRRTITVNSAVYNDWIDNGGAVSTLVGSALSKAGGNLRIKDIDKSLDVFKAAWVSYSSRQSAQVLYAAKSKVNRLIRESMLIGSAADLSSAELRYQSVNPQYTETANAKILEILDGAGVTSLADASIIIERCATEGRFYFTSAKMLLGYIKHHRETSGMESSKLMARVDYAAKWLVQQTGPISA